MKALLLAAGLGTRLRPFTFFRAKPTLPVLGVPFLHYPLRFLRSSGVDHVVINLHAHPDSVRSAAGNEFEGMKIEYSFEPKILGTAGALWKARELLGTEPFVVMNSDMICDISLQDVYRRHCDRKDFATLVVMNDSRFAKYSGLQFHGENELRLGGIGGPYHYTGVQVVSPEVIEAIRPETKSEVFVDVYPALLNTGRISGFLHSGLWLEIGNLEQYLQTSRTLLERPLPDPLRPSGMLNSLISKKAKVAEGAIVENSIVMDGATIRSGVHVKYSIIGWDVAVDKNVDNAALARGVTKWWIKKQ